MTNIWEPATDDEAVRWVTSIPIAELDSEQHKWTTIKPTIPDPQVISELRKLYTNYPVGEILQKDIEEVFIAWEGMFRYLMVWVSSSDLRYISLLEKVIIARGYLARLKQRSEKLQQEWDYYVNPQNFDPTPDIEPGSGIQERNIKHLLKFGKT